MPHNEQAAPIPDNRVDAASDVHVSRRQVLFWGGTIAAAVAVYGADVAVTNWHWPGKADSIQPLPESQQLYDQIYANENGRYPSCWLGAPGLGHESGEPVAAAVGRTALGVALPRHVVLAVELGSRRLTDRTYVDLARTYELAKRFELIHVAGQSMGGLLPIHGALELSTLGVEDNLIRIGHWAGFGTPGAMEHVNKEFIARELSKVARLYEGGFIGVSATEAVAELLRPRPRWSLLGSMIQAVFEAVDKTWDGESPRLKVNGFGLLGSIDLRARQSELKNKGIISADSYFGYVMSDLDDIVDCQRAAEDIGNLVVDCNGHFEVFRSRSGTKHANVEVGSEELKDWAQGANRYVR
jgi:hypothetical protein